MECFVFVNADGCNTTSTELLRPEEEVTKEVAAAEAAFHQAVLAGDAAKFASH